MKLEKYLTKEQVKDVLKRYSEPHRHFHTIEHVEDILNKVDGYDSSDIEDKLILTYSAIFHDIVYDPIRNDNEEMSVEVMKSFLGHSFDSEFIDKISNVILDTKKPKTGNYLSSIFNSFDRDVLMNGDASQLIEYGNKIWFEYSFHSYKNFLTGHFSIIDSLTFGNNRNNLDIYKKYMMSRKLRLAIYPGSFNPYHKGHEYIVNQANNLFDKVVVAKGINPNKIDVIPDFQLDKIEISGVKYFETIQFTGLLSDLVSYYETEGYDVTIVKGIRNYQDLDSEMSQRKFLNDIKNDLKYVFVPCSEEFNYISSSAIRSLQKFGKDVSKYVP